MKVKCLEVDYHTLIKPFIEVENKILIGEDVLDLSLSGYPLAKVLMIDRTNQKVDLKYKDTKKDNNFVERSFDEVRGLNFIKTGFENTVLIKDAVPKTAKVKYVIDGQIINKPCVLFIIEDESFNDIEIDMSKQLSYSWVSLIPKIEPTFKRITEYNL